MDRTEEQDLQRKRQRHHVHFEREPDTQATRQRRSIMEVDTIYAMRLPRPASELQADPAKPDLFSLLTSAYLLYNRIIDEFVKPEGITAAQFPVLIAIRRRRDPTITQLSKLLDIAPSNVTTICKALEAQNLITRSSDPLDGRVVHIEPNEELDALYRRLDKAVTARSASFNDTVTAPSDYLHSQPIREAAYWLDFMLHQFEHPAAEDAEAD